MADLVFFTDRYPYNNSETFIENEIDILASYFDNVYCLPCGLMVDTMSKRTVPKNVHVLLPACSDNIYLNKPSNLIKVIWAIKNLYLWFFLCFFSKHFYKEIHMLISEVGFTIPRFMRILRTLGPAIRNKHYYKNKLSKEDIKEFYAYSYWIEPTVMFAEDILPKSLMKKAVCRTHRWDLYVEESSIKYLAFQKQVIDYVNQVYVISNDGVNYLKKLYPSFANKIYLSRLGTIDYGLNPDMKDECFRIISCSNLIPVKRVELIIDSLRILSENYSSIEWIHFGTGQYLDQIKKYAAEKLQNMHYEFKGSVPNSQIMEYYRNTHVDLFVNVSSSEGIPVSIMEACSFGIPVIATNVGGTSEIVYHKKNGYLLEKDFHTETLAKYITDLILSESLIKKMRIESREIWTTLFLCDRNYHNFYNCLIESYR